MVAKTSKKVTKKTRKSEPGWFLGPRQASTSNDVKNAVLLVSLGLNLAVFVFWLALKLTNQYDAQVYQFLFHR